MGHKVNPNGFRLGVIKGWDSRWYAGRNYKDLVYEDYKLRQLINKRLANAGVARIEIERLAGTQISISIHTAKPGIVIGKNGENVERLRQALEIAAKKKVRLSILEIRNPEVEAVLIARGIAEQIEKRISFRRAMKQAVQKAMRQGAKGVKVIMGGRLGGAEIARTEKEVEGSVPLQTLRANIDYGLAEAHTTYGVIGIKVWVYHGDVLPERQRAEGLLSGAGSSATPAPMGGERGGRGPRGEGRGGPRGEGRGGPRGESRGGGPRGEGRGAPRGEGRPPMGDRSAPRAPRGEGRPAGERAPRAPRAEGRPAGERAPRAPRASVPPTAEAAAAQPETPVSDVTPTAQPETTPTPENGSNGSNGSNE